MKLKLILGIIVILGCVGTGAYLLNHSTLLKDYNISRVVIHDGVVDGKSGTFTNITGLSLEFTNVSVYINGHLNSYKINGLEQ